MGKSLNEMLKEKVIESGRTFYGVSRLAGIPEKRGGMLFDGKEHRIDPGEYFRICDALNIDPVGFHGEYEAQR